VQFEQKDADKELAVITQWTEGDVSFDREHGKSPCVLYWIGPLLRHLQHEILRIGKENTTERDREKREKEEHSTSFQIKQTSRGQVSKKSDFHKRATSVSSGPVMSAAEPSSPTIVFFIFLLFS